VAASGLQKTALEKCCLGPQMTAERNFNKLCGEKKSDKSRESIYFFFELNSFYQFFLQISYKIRQLDN
jgi:hypothetical protein